jgi:hypothetical protein
MAISLLLYLQIQLLNHSQLCQELYKHHTLTFNVTLLNLKIIHTPFYSSYFPNKTNTHPFNQLNQLNQSINRWINQSINQSHLLCALVDVLTSASISEQTISGPTCALEASGSVSARAPAASDVTVMESAVRTLVNINTDRSVGVCTIASLTASARKSNRAVSCGTTILTRKFWIRNTVGYSVHVINVHWFVS